jgi:hypothetical protein
LGKETIPNSSVLIDDDAVPGEAQRKILDLAELILSMDIKKVGGLVAFGIVKGSKSKDYEDGNGQVAWSGLKNKYAPKIAPFMVKLERDFCSSKLKKGTDPDVWIMNLEELRDRLEAMGSVIKDDQFLVHILNNLSPEYERQVLFVEKQIKNPQDPLTVETLCEELDLKFERLHSKDDDKTESTDGEKALPMVQFKGRCNSCGKYGTKVQTVETIPTMQLTRIAVQMVRQNQAVSREIATSVKNTATRRPIVSRRRTKRKKQTKQAMQPKAKESRLC